MQQLKFEPSWNKAVAAKDREQIEHIFRTTKNHVNKDILFSPIRVAINHKKEFLATVLIHNFTSQELAFNNTRLVYTMENELVAEHVFTVPALTLPPETSMPWTFIFPTHNYVEEIPSLEGNLRIEGPKST
ncbi:SLAP domain-containing protein [Psychrobacillus sp. FSL K6-4046]|uniref:SLAP domain-containing protein n=1 Tax=unclassified Psychrobacillus TaxID=2636677 RepID=UPI00203CA94A|nr:SLAP domain-containing protein [Psychrobacillus sp. MER TA 171]MCM3359422.1 SLAP domain-containing protein [Psychrobacillus sp. MER TA 171]